MATLCYKRIRYTLFIFFNKMEKKLILITEVGLRKILNTFDIRDCHNKDMQSVSQPSYFYSYKVKDKKINCWKSASAP